MPRIGSRGIRRNPLPPQGAAFWAWRYTVPLNVVWTFTEWRSAGGGVQAETRPIDGNSGTGCTFLGMSQQWWKGDFTIDAGAQVDTVTVKWWTNRSQTMGLMAHRSGGALAANVTLPGDVGPGLFTQVLRIPTPITGDGRIHVAAPADGRTAGINDVQLSGGPKTGRRLWRRDGQWYDAAGNPTTLAADEFLEHGRPPTADPWGRVWAGSEAAGWSVPAL